MMVSGAQQDFDFEDRADAVRRALGGLVGTRKGGSALSNFNNKPAVTMHQPAITPAPQPMQTPVPRIPLQSASISPSRQQSKDAMKFTPTTSPAESANKEMKPTELYTPVSQSSGTGETVHKANATSKDAQELLCQLRQTEKQPIRGLVTDTALPAPAPVAQPVQRFRSRNSVGNTGKKKTEIEKENDKLLDELEALGEPAIEMPGETPIDMNQRLRKEATAAMLKHSFFIKKRPTPPASSASGDFTNRS